MKRYVVLSAVVLAVFGLGIFFILEYGGHLPPPKGLAPGQTEGAAKAAAAPSVGPGGRGDSVWSGIENNLREPVSRLFLQLILIVMATRLTGALFRKLGQPGVVGEMFAGVLLGPSFFGALFPGGFDFVFQGPTLGTLRLFSQIGVCLFMFIVGMELDVAHLRHQARTAVAVSNVSILLPFFLGVAAALFLYSPLAGAGTPFVSFALFLGISMSITAFPVLVRILKDRGLEQTLLGTTSTICAAVGDVTAWTLLAFVVAIAKSSGLAASGVNLCLVVLFIVVMLFLVRPQLARWYGSHEMPSAAPSQGTLAAVLVFTFASALGTEIIGIHALFGAFLAGVVMPRQAGLRDYLVVRLENFSSTFLVPLFFAFTGLRTQIGLLNSAESWLYCAGIIGIATVGKLGGSMIAARCTGLGWIDAFSLGALMNTRGLMELIAINIGYDLGILSSQIFAMLVLMALVTTFLTGPLLTVAEGWKMEERRWRSREAEG